MGSRPGLLLRASAQELKRRYPSIPPPPTPDQEQAFRDRQIAHLRKLSAPWTEYHVTLTKEPPPNPPNDHSWLRISPTTHRLARNPPPGREWQHWELTTSPYRKRYADPELTELQIQELLAVPGNSTDGGLTLRLASRYDTLNNSWRVPEWHTPEELEPYDYAAQSDVIEQQAHPSAEQKAAYRRRDGSMDWLRFVRDKWEAKLGYPEIMAWWQYLDLRAQERAPGVSEAALATGIPKMRPTNVPKYIAAVALALQAKRITQEEANAMLYAAQLLIGALKVTGPHQTGKPRGKQVAAARARELPILTAELVE